LNPKIDRELSTICLKCLEKDPQRRYSSALALAEDLEHWLRHEPIRAKPSGLFTHARKWVRRNPSTTVLVTLLIALAVGLGVTVWNRKPAVLIPKSVAVLPFENLSDDPDNAYFAEGIQQEILTRLANISDLKVISRTSTQRYHSKPGNLAEIAKQLGVANIVEGTVQKAADQVRVNVQLINVQTDSHLWAETYDRKLTDIFGVESEIAKRIAESLQAKLTGREEQALAVKPTNNPEAYDAYLHGLVLQARGTAAATNNQQSQDLRRKVISSYERAVQLDPNFAIAWARLSREDARYYFGHWDLSSARRGDAAKRALESAQRLQPNSSDTLLALGYYQYWVLRDYAAAKTTFGRVSDMLPGSSEVPHALAFVTRREGHWDQSVAYFEQALTFDPRNVELLTDAAGAYAELRQFLAALKLYDRALDITPNDPDLMAEKASIYQAQGNLQEAAKLLENVNTQTDSVFGTKITQLRLERNYGEAVRLLQDRLAEFHFDSQYSKAVCQIWLAFTQALADDVTGASVTAERTLNILEQLHRDQPDNKFFVESLSQAYAMMGQKDSALKAAEQAIVLLPTSKDQVWGPGVEENLALIQTIVGENSRAVQTLTKLLKAPYDSEIYPGVAVVTPALLRLDPIWDPLRSDPAFQKLCEEKIDKSIAVLPFENLSGDPDNAYLAEGIQQEILTRLAKIADLKVISRASTQRYHSKPGNLAEIAKQLGVANILEGSVQKAAEQVRVSVQLINAQTDSHLWADTYDRKLTDILGVESEIAKRIAESLQAKLTGSEDQALAVKPTNNPEAYDAYLRGVAFEGRNYSIAYSTNFFEQAAGFYERAVKLDPNFALGWARLSHADARLYFNHDTNSAIRGDMAKRALENAQKLEPDAPETLLALGYYQYLVLRDYAAAKTTFGRISKMSPANSEVPRALGQVTRREGHWDESIHYFEQALNLDPRDVALLMDTADAYAELRQRPAALKLFDRVLDITPNDPDVARAKACIYLAEGNLQESAKLLTNINEQTLSEWNFSAKIIQLRLERNYGEAVRLLQARLTQFHYDSQEFKASDQEDLVFLQRLAGDRAGTKVTLEQARNTLERLYRDDPDNWHIAADLSEAYALLGEEDSALKLAEHAIMLVPAKDPVWGPGLEENLALVQTICGENSRAISTLTRLLQTTYASPHYGSAITSAHLRLDPFWDPLRGDPAFQKLCEEKQP
jgi:TolB-like protein/predicted Zn-dependent protease